MKARSLRAAAWILCLGLVACAPRVTTDVVQVHSLTAAPQGTVQVKPHIEVAHRTDVEDLRRHVEKALIAQGFQPVEGPAEYTAKFNYHSFLAKPGTAKSLNLQEDLRLGQPQDLWGSVPTALGSTELIGDRVDATRLAGSKTQVRDWLLAVELTDPEGKQVFVGRAHSRNALEGTGLMIPILVDAMFADFPAASGETRRMVLTAGRNGEG